MNLFRLILYYIRRLQLKFTKYKYRKYLNTSSSNGGLKNFIGSDYTMIFNSSFEIRKQKVEKNVEGIVRKAKNNPYKLIDFVERHGTKVYKIQNANKILAFINETEGFITPKKGLKALYLNIILNKKLSFKFDECFILRNLALDPYYTIHQFYTWYAFKAGFAGYDYETQEKFNNLINSKNPRDCIEELSISDILAVKEAIHRDVEAIDFVINLAKATDGAKTAFQKLKTSTVNL